MKEKMSWLRWPLEHYSISLLIVGILFVMGIYGMYVMPKDEFPHATIRQGVVVAVYPGATSEEVELQVARPLERYLFTFGEVHRAKTTTTSQNGMCIVMVRLNDEVNNKDEVWSKIKHGLNNFKTQLPGGVLALVVNDDFGNTSALLIAIESDQRSYRELKQYSDDLSDRLRRIPSVANVKLYGEQKEQISLYVDRQRLQAYGIGQQMLFSRLQAQGITTMSGSISDDDQQIPIHIEAMENSEEEIANQIIFSDPVSGKMVRVRDIARVVREYDSMASRIEQNGHLSLQGDIVEAALPLLTPGAGALGGDAQLETVRPPGCLGQSVGQAIVLLPHHGYAAQTPEDGSERPEEPLALHQEVAAHALGGIVELPQHEVPVAGVGSQTDNILVGMLLCHFSGPSHLFVQQPIAELFQHSLFL